MTEEQHEWLDGKLKLKIGDFRFTLPIYSKEKRAKLHKLEKKEKWTLKEKERWGQYKGTTEIDIVWMKEERNRLI